MHNLPYCNNLISCAKKLRKDMTAQERKLWYCFLKAYPVKFYRQRAIDNFIADFYCAKACLTIELDGSQHYEEAGKMKDAARTAALEKHGIKIIRFSNEDINKNFSSVCAQIDLIVKKRISIRNDK